MSIKKRENTDWFLKQVFKATGLLTIGLLGGIFLMLLYNSMAFFFEIKPIDFFTGSQWDPGSAPSKYSIAPLLVSTGLVTLGAMLIAVPLGIFSAAFLAELAHPKLKAI